MNSDDCFARSHARRFVGASFEFFEETDSTNTRALESGCEGAVFVAERQSAGRGRHGRSWHSPAGLGLWFSVCLAAPLPGITFAAALAVRDAVGSEIVLDVKWPNDLYHEKRKVCGILVEQRGDRLALGIGLNVNQGPCDFPPALRHRAGSLAMATNNPWERAPLLDAILNRLDKAVSRLRLGDSDALRADWVKACDIVGKRIRRGVVSGCVTAVDVDGSLLVRTRAGLQRVTCGDVSVVGYR